MRTIYFVEDDTRIKYIIEKTISNAGYIGVSFQDGLTFLEKFKKEKPDLVILDIMLPNVSGFDLINQIRMEDKEIPIIMLSALVSEMDKVKAFDLGADDYLTKPFGVLELTARINAKLRNLNIDETEYCSNLRLDNKTHQVFVNKTEVYLTKKEFDILRLLLREKSKVLTREELFQSVWETDFIGETRTLDMHIKTLRKKLDNAQFLGEIKTIRGIGYKIE